VTGGYFCRMAFLKRLREHGIENAARLFQERYNRPDLAMPFMQKAALEQATAKR
jgi:hypothetical protein